MMRGSGWTCLMGLVVCACSRGPTSPAVAIAPPAAPAPSTSDTPASDQPVEAPWAVAGAGASEPRALVVHPPMVTPELRASPALELPPRERAVLPTGLRIVMVPDRRLPLVSVTLLVRTGAIDDPPGKAGLAELTATMLRQGTRDSSADDISQRVDRAGASLTTDSGYDLTTISCSARAQAFDVCLGLIAQLVAQPSFPPEELQEPRQRLLGAVRQARDDPAELSRLHFDNLLYGDGHPAGRPLTEESIDAITRADLVRFHRLRYVPGAAVLAIAGDVDPHVAMQRVRESFVAWPRRPFFPRRSKPVRDPRPGFTLLLVDKPDLSQSFFVLGHAGVPLTHPQRDVIRVVNFVLGGGGFNSRLMKVVRSEGGKTYGISSTFDSHEIDGAFRVASFTRHDELVNTLRLVRRELQGIRTTPPTDDELREAKGNLAGGYLLRFQTASRVANALAEAQLRGLPDTYVSELPLRINRIDAAMAAEGARTHLRPQRLVGAIVGKAEVVAPLLQEAGWSFTTVSYLDPISQRARARKAAQRSAAPGSGVGRVAR